MTKAMKMVKKAANLSAVDPGQNNTLKQNAKLQNPKAKNKIDTPILCFLILL
ncbi:hypothetical protein GCM10009430_18720 [Aquimarina litoralis]|uniref:Uncharacterized protein n=1 Tax=Aquimarina litoralis TaxID=584605 RepID=A0ABP3U040_9FLAO